MGAVVVSVAVRVHTGLLSDRVGRLSYHFSEYYYEVLNAGFGFA